MKNIGLEVEVFYGDKLPEEVFEEIFEYPKSEAEGWELNDRNILCIFYNGKIIDHHMDGMEPEDASFGRDLGWVPGAIRKAYELGKSEK